LIDQYVAAAARAWAVSRFSAERGDVQAALDQAQTMPMLSPQQVVFFLVSEAIEEFADKKRDDALRQMELYLADPAPFTVLVIEAAHLDQRMKLAKLLAEKSLVVQVDWEMTRASATRQLLPLPGRSRKNRHGIRIGAAEDLAECVAADLQR
jgi:DNA polymerase III delta subunit